jgi:phosphate:Na+ symporter
VSLLGLKFSVGTAAMPLIGAGALMRLLGRGRIPHVGLAIAGFGLIFVGIDVLQQGMQALGTRIDPGAFPGATFGGRLVLVLLGTMMTVVMQSSSAAVAATLTALHAGTIDLEQAATLVVGHSIGTTVTAAMASVGASVPARRTAMAHVLFNATTGLIAFLLVPLVFESGFALARLPGVVEPAVIIAGFHTGFTLLGVLLFAPFTTPFAQLVTRLIADKGPTPTRYLDESVTRMPSVAVEAARRTVMEVGASIIDRLRSIAAAPERRHEPDSLLQDADRALADTRRFLARIDASGLPGDRSRYLSLLHAIDHLDRLIERLADYRPRVGIVDAVFHELRLRAAAELPAVVRWMQAPDSTPPVALSEALSNSTAERRRGERKAILEATADGAVDPTLALDQLEALRWLDASLYHVWRMVFHLATPQTVSISESESPLEH